MNGKVSKFSVGKLIQFAGSLNLEAQVKLKKPKKLSSAISPAGRLRSAGTLA